MTTVTLPYETPDEETPEQAYARTHDENGHALFGEAKVYATHLGEKLSGGGPD